MKHKILVVGVGNISIHCANIIAKHNPSCDVILVDENSINQSINALDKLYPPEKAKPFVIKCHNPISECFIEKPKKPRYNPKTGKTKYF